MGTNCIPTLLDILGAKEWNKKRVVSKLKSKAFKELYGQQEAEDIRYIAVDGFAILGTNAESAVPQLSKLLHDPETCSEAAQVLTQVGPKGFSVLTNAINDEDLVGVVVLALGQKGGGDPQVITRLLINALKHPNPIIRGNTAEFLAGKDPDLVIPALIPLLDDSNRYPRRLAANSLGSYGPAAKIAVPKLMSIYTNLITGPDMEMIQVLGGTLLEALRAIDREAAGQAEAFTMNDGPLGGAGSGWTTTKLSNGRELIAGGSFQTAIPTDANHIFSRAQLFDPTTGKRTDTGSMNVAREFHMAVLLANGKVLVMGGENLGADGRLHDLTSAEIYDPATGQWTATGSMNSPHPSERAALQSNGKVLVYEGGFDKYPIHGHELYDPATGTWTVITNK